jgi:hypothetical protein
MATSTERRHFAGDLPYSVTVWGSNPDETDNDDCWTGADFATSEEACRAFMATVGNRFGIGPESVAHDDDFAFAMVDGPDVHLVAANPRFDHKRAAREAKADADEWRREIAMQEGMAFGVDAYNDAMGYGVGDAEDY